MIDHLAISGTNSGRFPNLSADVFLIYQRLGAISPGEKQNNIMAAARASVTACGDEPDSRLCVSPD
jgi:hypothetical protein